MRLAPKGWCAATRPPQRLILRLSPRRLKVFVDELGRCARENAERAAAASREQAAAAAAAAAASRRPSQLRRKKQPSAPKPSPQARRDPNQMAPAAWPKRPSWERHSSLPRPLEMTSRASRLL